MYLNLLKHFEDYNDLQKDENVVKSGYIYKMEQCPMVWCISIKKLRKFPIYFKVKLLDHYKYLTIYLPYTSKGGFINLIVKKLKYKYSLYLINSITPKIEKENIHFLIYEDINFYAFCSENPLEGFNYENELFLESLNIEDDNIKGTIVGTKL